MAENYWDKVTSNRVARRRLLRSGAALSVGAAALALVGCGDDDESTPSATTAPGATSAPGASEPTATTESAASTQGGLYTSSDGPPQPGDRYTRRWSTSQNYDPVGNWNEGTYLGGAHVFDRPITSREDERRFVLEAMESIETPDPLTVVMKLKPDQFFHDIAPVNGRALVAEDVAASQDYGRDASANFDRTFIDDFLESVEATDDLTVVYHLKKPNAYLYSQNMLGSGTGQPIMAQETFENIASATQVGSGPYQIADQTLSVNYLYEKFAKFREAKQGLPYIQEREIVFIPDAQASEAAFRGGQLDLWNGTATAVPGVLADMDTVTNVELLAFFCYYWHMNMYRDFPWETDSRVRQAFMRLTNREQIKSLGYNDNAELPIGLIPASIKAYQLDPTNPIVQNFYTEDPAEANKLLDAANFDRDRAWDCMASTAGGDSDATAQVWQQQLLRGGVKIQISNVTGLAQLFQRWTDNDWELMHQLSPGTDTPGQALRNQHSDGWSDTYWRFGTRDPEVDRLIEESETKLDFEENHALVTQAQLKAMEVWTPSPQLLTPIRNTLLSGRVQNWEITQVQPAYWHDMWVKE